jgi:hypothetical protein
MTLFVVHFHGSYVLRFLLDDFRHFGQLQSVGSFRGMSVFGSANA